MNYRWPRWMQLTQPHLAAICQNKILYISNVICKKYKYIAYRCLRMLARSSGYLIWRIRARMSFAITLGPLWFRAYCCGADMFSRICSQLLCCSQFHYCLQPILWRWHIQYGLQPIVLVLTCSVWFIANCCVAHMFSMVYSQFLWCDMFRVVYSQLLWCWHVHYDLQSIVVLLAFSVWFTVNCCATHVSSLVYSQLAWC